MNFIDSFLNKITMYKLVLFGLTAISGLAIIFGFLGILPFSALDLSYSLILLFLICLSSNILFAKIFKASTNIESWAITALILFLIMSPSPVFSSQTLILALAGIFAMASKYVLAFRKKHIFNPAAFGAASVLLLGIGGAIWWIGDIHLFPAVVLVGFLILQKIKRYDLFFSFVITNFASILFFGLLNGSSISSALSSISASFYIAFFATVMLTEPLTTPPTKLLRLAYAAIIGLFSGWPFQIGPIYSVPEYALLIGNIFSFIVSPKYKLILKLKEKNKIAKETFEFVLNSQRPRQFKPGQYMEWTLPHKNADLRGNRRFFTITSSPTEKEIRLGIKFSDPSSSFKKRLISMERGEYITAGNLSGDFVLPQNPNIKLSFIAGGIGITPFRSIIKYLQDKREKRDITLFYVNRNTEDIAFREVFEKGKKILGIKVIYVLTNKENIPENWEGKIGYINEGMIAEELPDYKKRLFYLSGPVAMVDSYRKLLLNMGLPAKQILTDYFPGY